MLGTVLDPLFGKKFSAVVVVIMYNVVNGFLRAQSIRIVNKGVRISALCSAYKLSAVPRESKSVIVA